MNTEKYFIRVNVTCVTKTCYQFEVKTQEHKESLIKSNLKTNASQTQFPVFWIFKTSL